MREYKAQAKKVHKRKSSTDSWRIHFNVDEDDLLDYKEEISKLDTKSLAHRDQHIESKKATIEEWDALDST